MRTIVDVRYAPYAVFMFLPLLFHMHLMFGWTSIEKRPDRLRALALALTQIEFTTQDSSENVKKHIFT